MSDSLPPRIPRALAVGRQKIRERLYDIEQELDRGQRVTLCACGKPVVQPARGRRRRWCSDRCRKSTQRALTCPEMQVLPSPDEEAERARRALPVTAFGTFAELDVWLEERGR